MDDNRIAQAWNTMKTRQHMEAEKAERLLKQVKVELLTASTEMEERTIAEFSEREKIGVTRRLTIYNLPQEELTGGQKRSAFRMEALREDGTQELTIAVEADMFSPPAVSDPARSPEMKLWTEEDGPQEEWVLDNLRGQVAGFLDEQKQWE
jgi:hypothetical protein